MSGLPITASFGASVRSRRFRLGISQEELAERAGLHRTYIAGIERGGRNITLKSIEKLAQALGISVGKLLGEPDKSVGANAVDLLLVEDDPKDIELTLEAFKEARLTNKVHIVRDGAAAIDFLFGCGAGARRRTDRRPQVVLLDLNLPKVHGLEVLRRIKTDKLTRGIHVIVLTASKKDEHVRKAMQLGAATYIVKPVDFQSLSEVTPGLNCDWALLQSAASP